MDFIDTVTNVKGADKVSEIGKEETELLDAADKKRQQLL